MSKRLLCDTNVWLGYYFGLRPHHRIARDLITRGCRAGIEFLVPSSCLGDIFYLCQHDFKQALRAEQGHVTEQQARAAQVSAWSIIEHLLELATVVGSDHGDARIALKHRGIHADFEDDLVIAAALRASADCLVTGDEKMRRHSPVLTLDVPEALAYFGLHAPDETS